MGLSQPANGGDTLLIADDHELFRLALGQVLQRHIGAQRVVEAGRFEDALALLEDRSILLALVDLDMPGLHSPGELERIRRLRPDIRLVVISGSDSREDMLAALCAGAHGYIVKTARPAQIVQQVAKVLAGEICVPWSIAELSPGEAPIPERAEPAHNSIGTLTDRQRQVLQLLAKGQPNKTIGRSLGISEGTVKMHVSVILRAIGATNRAQAAAMCRQILD